MGLPGVAYLTGIADPGWTAIGLGVGTVSYTHLSVPDGHSQPAQFIWLAQQAICQAVRRVARLVYACLLYTSRCV